MSFIDIPIEIILSNNSLLDHKSIYSLSLINKDYNNKRFTRLLIIPFLKDNFFGYISKNHKDYIDENICIKNYISNDIWPFNEYISDIYSSIFGNLHCLCDKYYPKKRNRIIKYNSNLHLLRDILKNNITKSDLKKKFKENNVNNKNNKNNKKYNCFDIYRLPFYIYRLLNKDDNKVVLALIY